MMRKIFLLLFCLILLPPVWASEEFYGEISNDYQPNFSQEEQPAVQEEIMPQEEVSLFSPEESDSNTDPLSTYKGPTAPVFKGGVSFYNEDTSTVVSKDGTLMTIKPRRHGLGELLFGDASSTRDNSAGFFGYHKGRFSITHTFERAEFKKELARNSMSVEPELQLSKNLKFKTSFRASQSQKGASQGVGLEYGRTDSRFKKINNMKFELKATTTLSAGSDSVKRFTFNTKYYF